MPDTPSPVVADTDLSAADIAADDAGGGALGRNTGRTAGGDQSGRFAAPAARQGDVAADDAGATAQATEAVSGPAE